jgi:hypothetical protein
MDLTELLRGRQTYEQMATQQVREAFNRYSEPTSRVSFVVVPSG